jgi:hypothetical protein
MKSLLFTSAIRNRNRVKFLYGFEEINLEPYYIARNKKGKKVLYGKLSCTNEIKMYEYDKMCNIKIDSFGKFSPVIPIIQRFN